MNFEISYDFNTDPKTIFKAFLDSEKHSEMTGGEAITSNIEGKEFTAWDEYISGKNISIKPYSYIKQSWRTSELEQNQEDSIIEIYFKQTSENKTHLLLVHSNLGENKSDYAYKQGWIDHYFIPMAGLLSKLKLCLFKYSLFT